MSKFKKGDLVVRKTLHRGHYWVNCCCTLNIPADSVLRVRSVNCSDLRLETLDSLSEDVWSRDFPQTRSEEFFDRPPTPKPLGDYL